MFSRHVCSKISLDYLDWVCLVREGLVREKCNIHLNEFYMYMLYEQYRTPKDVIRILIKGNSMLDKTDTTYEDWITELKDLALKENMHIRFDDSVLQESYEDGDSIYAVLKEIRNG